MSEEKKTKYNEIPSNPGEAKSSDKVTAENPTETPSKFKQVEGIVVETKKRNMFERLVVGIAGPNGVKGIVSNLYGDIIVPAIQQTFFDSIVRGAQQAIFGESNPGVQVRGRTNYSQISQHQTPYVNHSPIHAPHSVGQVQQKNSIDQIGIRDRSQADLALSELLVYASKYGVASVADYMEIMSQPSVHTHNGWGWTYQTLLGVRIVPGGGLYYLDLPRPVQIGNTP